MHTPEQARELWCPMVRIARRETYFYGNGNSEHEAVVGGCNTDAIGRIRVPASCSCIADQCAMWRWQDNAPPQDGIDRTTEHAARRGYCGLAGRPEVLP